MANRKDDLTRSPLGEGSDLDETALELGDFDSEPDYRLAQLARHVVSGIGEITANPGYAKGQLEKARATASGGADADTRARAQRKAERWEQVIAGMNSGSLAVGSRTPVAGVPSWVTLEVLAGGFASRNFLAAGDLQTHERSKVDSLGLAGVPPGAERGMLNAYYLSESGLSELSYMLDSGCYRVNVPEEGALLVVAWLLRHGHAAEARNILDAIGPFFSKLRFYPVPDTLPLMASSLVHLRTVGDTVAQLKNVRTRAQVNAQKEAILVWNPFLDRVVELFLETVEEGWPCQTYPNQWFERAEMWLIAYHRAKRHHKLCTKHEREGGNFCILRSALEKCLDSPKSLTGREVSLVRSVLRKIEAKRGLPSSQQCQTLREEQAEVASRPGPADLAKVLMERLAKLPQKEGLDSLEAVLQPVTVGDAEREAAVPQSLVNKVARCLRAPIDSLIDKGIITSAEVLATVVPQITSQVRASAIEDASLRRLYAAIYRAFSQRRSLLLLNLEHQVRFEELPWIAALTPFRNNLSAKELARQTIGEVSVLAIESFPETILPNKLLSEIDSLVRDSKLDLPVVNEIAADIFEGTFTGKYLRSAKKAGALLRGSLYERYYGIPYDRVSAMEEATQSRFGARTSEPFAALCRELAGKSNRYGVAANGKIIEQEQILTTHNLAALFEEFGLADKLGTKLEELPRLCFQFVCRRQQQKITDWKAQLQMVKNTAYAWRQMLFFLSVMTDEAVEDFLVWAHEHLSKQSPEYQTRFALALEGLSMVSKGISVGAHVPPGQSNPLRFLGWTTEKHWLLGGTGSDE